MMPLHLSRYPSTTEGRVYKMSRLKQGDEISNNFASKDNKVFFHPKKRPFSKYFAHNTNPTVLLFTFYLVITIACLACSCAQPYQANLNDISWSRYVAPSPSDVSDETFNDYEDDRSEDEQDEGIIEESSSQSNKNHVSHSLHEFLLGAEG